MNTIADLTAQDIFDVIIKGSQQVRYPLGKVGTQENISAHNQFTKLMNHLNVIKSRSKKLIMELGLQEVDNILIRYSLGYGGADNLEQYATIFIVKGEPEKKKHTVTIIS